MEKRPPSGRIQKTTTSKIAFIGLAAATMMITVSIIGSIQLQEASAVRPTFCYSNALGGIICFGEAKDCHESYKSNPFATGGCRPIK